MKKRYFPLFLLLSAGGLRAEPAAEEKPAATYVDEAPLPEGWPKPGPHEAVAEKRYAAYRAAFTKGKGEFGAFWTLFAHIKKHDIPMTAPVEMGVDEKNEQVSMGFLYQNGKVGSAGRDGAKVEVRDMPAIRAELRVAGARFQRKHRQGPRGA